MWLYYLYNIKLKDMKDRIVKLIKDAGDAFGNQMQKNVAVGSVIRNFQVEENRNNLIKEIEADNRYSDVSEIVLQTENAVIFLNRVKGDDMWDKLYPYRVAIRKNDKWITLSEVCDTLESAMILYIATKNNRNGMINAVMHLLDIQVKEF